MKVPGSSGRFGIYRGRTDNPRYEDVSSGKTGHLEAVQIYYDPAKVSYPQLLDVFWRHIDPSDDGGRSSTVEGSTGARFSTG